MIEQIEGQMDIFQVYGQDIWSGKTCRAHFQAQEKDTQEKTSKQSSRKSQGSSAKIAPMFLYLKKASGLSQDALWVTEMTDSRFPSHTDFTTASFGESPSVAVESRLSQILEEHPLQKYCLSERACQGILNRANRRGKKLPEQLEQALIRQATPSKLGGGVERDSYGKKAGKGPLVQTELSGTLGVSQDQTLITKCLNPWDVQSKHIQPEDGKAEALYSGECRYGGGESYVMQSKVYGISPYDSNAMKSSNPHSGIYEADTSRTLDLNGGSPACNQGGMIVLEGNGSRESHRGDGYKESETMYSLNTVEQHAICVDQGAGKSSCQVEVEKSPTLATTHDGAPAVCTYQKTTGCLAPGAHAGSYNGQDAYNDMLVIDTPVTSIDEKMGQTYIGEEVGNTLSARDYKQPQAVVYGIDQQGGKGGANYTQDVSPTLASDSHGTPHGVAYSVDCYNQTQAEEVTQPLRSINADSDHIPCVIAFQGQAGAEASLQVGEDLSPTLLSGKNAMVSYGLDRASFNQGQNAKYDFAIESDLSPTILAKGPGGWR